MRHEIQQLEEAIAGVVKPLGGVQSKAQEGEPLDERGAFPSPGPTVTPAQVKKLVDALVESPKAQQVMSKILEKSGGETSLGGGRMATLQSVMRHFLQHSVPLALEDFGMKVQGAMAGKARRGLKAVAAGKGMAEVIELWDEPLSESDSTPDDGSSLREELEGIL